jgi:hypothetical protein
VLRFLGIASAEHSAAGGNVTAVTSRRLWGVSLASFHPGKKVMVGLRRGCGLCELNRTSMIFTNWADVI